MCPHAGRLRSGLFCLGINFWLLPRPRCITAVNYSGHPALSRNVGHRLGRNESLCRDYELLSRLTGDCVQLNLSSFGVPTCWYLHKLWEKQLYSRQLRHSWNNDVHGVDWYIRQVISPTKMDKQTLTYRTYYTSGRRNVKKLWARWYYWLLSNN